MPDTNITCLKNYNKYPLGHEKTCPYSPEKVSAPTTKLMHHPGKSGITRPGKRVPKNLSGDTKNPAKKCRRKPKISGKT